MSSYWAVVGVILTLLGTAFWRLVWNFLFNAPHERYSPKIGEACDVIYERKFLPIIASICDSVVIRKDILRTAETVELLNEFSISAKLRGDLVSVVSERIALERSYGWACRLGYWVAFPWLACIVLLGVLFLGHFDAHTGIKSLWVPTLAIPIFAFGGVGCGTFGLYLWALSRFKRLLRAIPL